MDPSGQPSRSAAQRRRERRLRSMLRHERVTVAMALAGEEDLELHYTAEFQTHPPPQAAGIVFFAMDVDDVPAVKGSRPDRLSEVRPQERVLRRTVEQNVDVVTFPALDVPMPQMVDQPLALLLSAHFPDPEQVIEVPKISLPSRPSRRFPRILETAEQLVQVSLDLVARIGFVDPIADIPALRGPVFHTGQGCSLTAEQIVANPVPRRGFGGGLLGLHPGQSSSAFYGADHRVAAATAEQNVDIPAPRGAPQDFHQNPLPATGSSDLLETANQVVFRTFLRRKNATIPRTQGSELGADFSSWPP